MSAVVAIETATETVGVAVRTTDGVQAEFALTGRRRHVETLTPAIEHLLAQVGLTPAALDLVAVDVGPGLFTGLRVGVAAAKALALARGIGVVGATSLDILVAGAAAHGHRGPVLACVDARRGEVFAAVHEVGDGGGAGPAVLGPGLFAPPALAEALGGFAGGRLTAVGDGAQRYAAQLAGAGPIAVVAPGLAFPPPTALADLALARLAAGEAPTDPGLVLPLYLREADARVNFAARRPPGARGRGAVALTLRLEKLRRRDLRALMRIENAVFPEPWSPTVFSSELALRTGRLYRGAWAGGELAGYIGFMIVDDEAHVTTIATAPDFQRAGVASAMLVATFATLRVQGVRHVSLEVAANNEPAQALYRRFGFAPVGVRRNYYPVTGQDALVMWVHDIDAPAYAARLADLAASGAAVEGE